MSGARSGARVVRPGGAVLGRTPALVAASVAWVALVALAGCGGPEDGAARERPAVSPMPDGLVAWFDQGRAQRQGRTVFVRLVDEPERQVTVTRLEVRSDRFAEVVWTGEETFENETDLDFELPPARCGEGSDAEVTLTYRLDDGPLRVTTTTAPDRYGQVALFLTRECARSVLADAATLEVGDPRVEGRARASVLALPVTLTPTGDRDDVVFAGFEHTVLFRVQAGSPSAEATPAPRLRLGPGVAPLRTVLRLVPGRCDPHALAEDKIGTLIGVRVLAPELPEAASFALPLTDAQRAALRRFVPVHCGW